ncbi:MAG: hypothetical protein ABJB65_02390 [Chloroflexota bacterium]
MSAHRPLSQIACPPAVPSRSAVVRLLLTAGLLLGWVSPASGAPVRMDNASDLADTAVAHLVLSELVTGGASASDEFAEIYNPAAVSLPLEGLELVYVTASGATVTRKASWAVGAEEVPSHHHLLVANAAGIYAAIADMTYASGLAATGGSLALRIQGAVKGVDAVGWGTATAWLEGTAASAPAAGASLERLPGGAAGSGQDTDDNLADFAILPLPDPQNSTAAPTPDPTPSPTPPGSVTASPSATGTPGPIPSPTPTTSATASPTPGPSPTIVPTPVPSPTATPTLTPTPVPTPTSIAAARALSDGSTATISGVALTGSDFSEGGGYIDDGSGGIAVLMADGAFERGARLVLGGTIHDRYAQRTLRSSAADLTAIGTGLEPSPAAVATGGVGEPTEGRLVSVSGEILAAPTSLSGGLAFDVDDGTGAVRVFVGTTTAIGTTAWSRGATLTLVGVVGQRDSSGTGAAGYRVQPRDPADIVQVLPPATPAPSPTQSVNPTPAPTVSPTPSATPRPSGSPSPGNLVSIAAARAASTGTRLRIRGIVTLGSGPLDAASAVVQDSSAGILIRLGDEAGRLLRGEQVELTGTRSTKSGMLSLRVTEPPAHRAAATAPAPVSVRTGSAGEEHEARLIRVRAAIATTPRRSSAGSLSFDLDDGSGPLHVVVLAAVAPDVALPGRGAWVEIVGVLGQETTGALPRRGYRLWPRTRDDLRTISLPVDAVVGAGASSASADDPSPAAGAVDDLAPLLPGAPARPAGGTSVRATLVHGAWPELGLAGLLWDGRHLVGLVDGVLAETAVSAVLAGSPLPIAVQLLAQRAAEGPAPLRLALITLGTDARLERAAAPAAVAAPVTDARDANAAVWARLVGRLTSANGTEWIEPAPGLRVAIERRCRRAAANEPTGQVMVEGILAAKGQRLVIGCGAVTSPPLLGVSGAAATPVPRSNGPVAGRADAVRSDGRNGLAGLLALIVAGIALGGLGVAVWRRRLSGGSAAATALGDLSGPLEAPEPSYANASDDTESDVRLAPLRLVEPTQEVELPLRV